METTILDSGLPSGARSSSYTIAHRNHPSAIWSFAIRHEDDSVSPVKGLYADTVKLPPVPCARISRQDDDVAALHASRIPPATAHSGNGWGVTTAKPQ
jgi:hypothetical protein